MILESVVYTSNFRAGQTAKKRIVDEVCYDLSMLCMISLAPKPFESCLRRGEKKKKKVEFPKEMGQKFMFIFNLDHFSGLFYCTIL